MMHDRSDTTKTRDGIRTTIKEKFKNCHVYPPQRVHRTQRNNRSPDCARGSMKKASSSKEWTGRGHNASQPVHSATQAHKNFAPHPLSAQGDTAVEAPCLQQLPWLGKNSPTLSAANQSSPAHSNFACNRSDSRTNGPHGQAPKTERSNLKIAATSISSWPARNP